MFNVTIKQEALMKALEYLEPTVGRNSTNLGDNCVCMESTTIGSIIMYTTNTIEFSKIEVIATSTTQDKAPLVDFKRFKGIISTIPTNEYVTLTQNINDLLISFALRSTPIRLIGDTNGMLPFPTVNQNDVVSVPASFLKTAISNAANIIIESNTASLYNCIKIHTDGIGVTAEAIDITNKRTFITSGTATCQNKVKDILLEAPKLKKSLKIFEDYTEIEMTVDSVVFLRGTDIVPASQQKTKGNILDVVYCFRQLSGVFPNVSSYYKKMPTEFIRVPASEIIGSIARVKAIGESNSFQNGININVDNNKFSLNFSSTYGDIVDDMTVSNPIKSAFNMRLKHDSLEDILKSLSEFNEIEIGVIPIGIPNSNFIIKACSTAGSGNPVYSNEMFTISSMVSNNQTSNTP